MNKKVLIIAYYFPPCGGGSTVRVHNFTKYLPKYDITPVILTAMSSYYEEYYLDESLECQYSNETKIVRANVFFGNILKKAKQSSVITNNKKTSKVSIKHLIKNLIKSMLIPDEQIFWLPGALKAGKTIINETTLSAIISSGPPFTSHIVSALLAKKYGIPLILDYRDLWSSNQFYSNQAGFKFTVQKMIERKIIRSANKLIVTNANAQQTLMTEFNVPLEKINIIENGYDDDLTEKYFRNNDIPQFKDKLKINYVGSLTRQRTPKYFFDAISIIRQKYKIILFEINFIGFADESHKELVKDYNLDSIVNFIGSVTVEKAMEYVSKSDLLLLFQRQSEGGSTAIPGKVYEYLASGIPVLSMDEGQGATTKFLNDMGSVLNSEYNDVDKILSNLENIINNYDLIFKNAQIMQKDVYRFSRKVQVKQLAMCIQ